MAATKKIIALAAVVTTIPLLCFLGCQSTIGQRMNGTYEGFQAVETTPGTDPIIARQLGMVKIQAREDGTATLVNQGIPIDGRLEYGHDFATFVPEKFEGLMGNGGSDKLEQYQVELTPLPNGEWMYAGKIKLAPKHSSSR